MLINLARFNQTGSISSQANSDISKITVGSVYVSEKYDSFKDYVKNNGEAMVDVVVYFNMAGIVYLLLHSILLRRSLVILHS